MLIVVPSRRAAAQEADRCLAATPRASGRLAARTVWTDTVLTLRELPERALLCHPAPRPRLSQTAFAFLLSEIVDGLEPEVRSRFGPGIEAPGAARAIAAAVAEIRQAGLAAADLVAAARGHRRLAALAAVLDALERRLAAGGWWDDAAALVEAAALIEAGRWPAERLDRLEVRGLYDATPLQGRLLTALARRSGSVRVHVPFEPDDPDPTAYAYPYLHRWEAVTDPDLDIEIVYPGAEGESTRGERIEVESAADPADEARRIAAWIRRRLDEGVAPEAVAVVAAGRRPLDPLVRELGRRGVPTHARRGTPLVQLPLVAAALVPFRLLEDGFRRADLQAWVASPLTAALDPVLLLPALATGPAAGGSAGAWKRSLVSARGASARAIVAALGTLDTLRAARAPAEFWPAYGRVLAHAGLGPSNPSPADDPWGTWEDVLDDVREALEVIGRWEGPPLGWRAHRRHLLDALADRRAGRGRPGSGVALLTPRDARGLTFRHTAFAGLIQGALGDPGAARGILGDGERRALVETLGAPLFRLAAEEAKEGSLLLAERVRSTSGALLLSWPVEDGRGTPLLPALELEALRRAHGLPAPPPPLASPSPSWRSGRSAGRVAGLQELERDRSAFLARDPATRRGGGGRYDGIFAPEHAAAFAAEARDPRTRWSASRLETWRACPHRFYQRYVLGLEPPAERSLEPEASALGTLAHRALHLLIEADGLATPPDPERVAAIVSVAGDALEEHERGDPALWRVTTRRVAAALLRYLRHVHQVSKAPDVTLLPVAFELEFGLGPDRPPVVVEGPHGPVPLRGRLDRLDRDPATGRLHVVDYKYGKAGKANREAVDPGRCGDDRFQLYVYFLAARAWAAAEGLPESPEVTGTVHCIRAPRVLGPLSAPPPEAIAGRIASAVEAATAGRFDPTPRDSTVCGWCDYRRSCRIASVGLEEPPAADPEEEP